MSFPDLSVMCLFLPLDASSCRLEFVFFHAKCIANLARVQHPTCAECHRQAVYFLPVSQGGVAILQTASSQWFFLNLVFRAPSLRKMMRKKLLWSQTFRERWWRPSCRKAPWIESLYHVMVRYSWKSFRLSGDCCLTLKPFIFPQRKNFTFQFQLTIIFCLKCWGGSLLLHPLHYSVSFVLIWLSLLGQHKPKILFFILHFKKNQYSLCLEKLLIIYLQQ